LALLLACCSSFLSLAARVFSLSSPCICNMLQHWLLLVFCSVTRKNYFLSVFVYPETIITSCYHLPPWIHTEICVMLSCSSCSHSNSRLVNVMSFFLLMPHECWSTCYHLPSRVHTGCVILCCSSCIHSNSRLVNMMCFCLMPHESWSTNNTFMFVLLSFLTEIHSVLCRFFQQVSGFALVVAQVIFVSFCSQNWCRSLHQILRPCTYNYLLFFQSLYDSTW
jgi:hypothetical protein